MDMYESLRDYNRRQRREGLQRLIAVVSTLGIVLGGAVALGSCSKKDKETIPEDDIVTKTELSDIIVGNVEPGSVKTFDVGEHIISVRVSYNHFNSNGYENNNLLTGYAVNNIPEGYEVFQITPYERYVGEGSETGGYDIWFRNTEPVEVHVTYNEVFNQYGYYTFGEVIEEEKVLEK